MPTDPAPFLCIRCRQPLVPGESRLDCPSCGRSFPVDDGIPDFAEGRYYDHFDESTVLTAEQQAGLDQEVAGTAARIDNYYLPLIGKRGGTPRILDSGCGNGLSVDLLSAQGFETWGHDLSALRKWQWRMRERQDRLVVADALRLPFENAFFDVILSSGVIEHLGVEETGGATYAVDVLPSRDAERRAYLRELLRILHPGGSLYVDCPNGAFPIDFWHGVEPGGARWHARDEGFLPTVAELRELVASIDPKAQLRLVPPNGRLRFQQVGRHWYGRLFAVPMGALLELMSIAGFRWLAGSWLNPYLVVEIKRG